MIDVVATFTCSEKIRGVIKEFLGKSCRVMSCLEPRLQHYPMIKSNPWNNLLNLVKGADALPCQFSSESWISTAELEKRTKAYEMRCYRMLLNISYRDYVTNEEVRRKIQAIIGEHDELLTLVRKRNPRCFGHVLGSSGLAKTILQGTVNGKRRKGRQKEEEICRQY